MGSIRIGAIVTRQSHHNDIVFRITDFKANGQAELKGLTLRLLADAPLEDLVPANFMLKDSLAHARERLVHQRMQIRNSVNRSLHRI